MNVQKVITFNVAISEPGYTTVTGAIVEVAVTKDILKSHYNAEIASTLTRHIMKMKAKDEQFLDFEAKLRLTNYYRCQNHISFYISSVPWLYNI